MKKYYKESRKKETPRIQQNGGRLTGLIAFCVGTVFYTAAKIEGTKRRGRRRKQLLYATEKRGAARNWKMKR